MKRIASVILLALVVSGCSTATGPTVHGIPNFKQFAPGEYRGGQPASAEGWQYLLSLSVTNVVKFNPEKEASDDQARQLGMTVNYFPIDTLHQTVLKPDKAQMKAAVAQMKPGTYVHCEHGQDRTGLGVGLERVWVEHWTKQAAYSEMLTNGFHTSLHGLADFWEDDVP